MRTSVWTVAARTTLVGVLALATMTMASAQRNPPTLVVPFRYESLGVGDGAVQGDIVLTKNSEAEYVSRALLSALQDRQYALTSPKLGVGDVIPQGKTWTTDIVPLSQEVIAGHNEAFPQMTLPPRLYSVQYFGEYKVRDRELQFAISARLYEQAAATTPRKYRGTYSGDFFVAPLTEVLRTKLQQASGTTP